MGGRLLSYRKVTTRKPHKCIGCLEEIPKGAPAFYSYTVSDEGATSAYFCQPCDTYWREHPDEFEPDGIAEGEIGRVRKEAERDQDSRRAPERSAGTD